MKLNEEIGQRLRAARHGQKLSLAQLSARTNGLSKSRISNYEQGLRRMGIEEAIELSQALGGVTPAYLLCIEGDSALDAEEWQLINGFRSTDERGRRTILSVIEAQGPQPVKRSRRR